jgi:asparagine synthase (glutamine-hydrolysing)
MCGIAGIAALAGGAPATDEALSSMCATLHHRGPDEGGSHLGDRVVLGVRRLSIIDVEGGHQPFFNEDSSIRAVFNGEIYNFAELRRGLEATGHALGSGSDGEVIVHLLEEHGNAFVERLNGMFAIAVDDARRNRLLLVRDRLGIKPLFYAIAGNHLVFASEIKAILASGLVDREVDLDGLAEFLTWEYVPGPHTLFAGIRKLPPGSMLELDLDTGGHTITRHWDLPAPAEPAETRSDEEWEDAVDELLARCVRRQLVSDVPLGAFLSGGVDSSLVVRAMGPASAFNIAFGDASYDESRWAREVADHLEASLRIETLAPRATDLFESLMHYLDDPIGDFSIFPTYLVSQVARREVTVVLTGDGGDELFGGYETYVAQQKARTWIRIPGLLRRQLLEPVIERLRPRPAKKGPINKAKRFVEGMGHPAALGHARWRLFAGEALRRELFTADARSRMKRPAESHILALNEQAGGRGEIDRALYTDLKSYLVDNCLVKVDRMSMACSLEARVPMLDHELVELAFRLPERLKVSGGECKVLLKRVAARHVPRRCVYRHKEGFSIPIKHWLAAELRPVMEDLLSRERLAAGGILETATVDRLKGEHLDGRANHSHILWALMVFEDWRRRWSV